MDKGNFVNNFRSAVMQTLDAEGKMTALVALYNTMEYQEADFAELLPPGSEITAEDMCRAMEACDAICVVFETHKLALAKMRR